MSKPDVILVSQTFAAMVEAHVKFAGRNWRRIKREVNKAVRQVRLQHKPRDVT